MFLNLETVINIFFLSLIKILGANVFCHLDSTQYHKNQIPQKLEQIILSSCTHILFSSADTNFDTIANNWYSSQTNGINIRIYFLCLVHLMFIKVLLIFRHVYFNHTIKKEKPFYKTIIINKRNFTRKCITFKEGFYHFGL